MQFKEGDIVARKSHLGDVYFKIVELYTDENGRVVAILRGLDVRLLADAPLEDLEVRTAGQVREYRQAFVRQHSACLRRILGPRSSQRSIEETADKKNDELNTFELPGRVLHIDGDSDYLNICMSTYKQLGIEAYGYAISEGEQPEKVVALLKEHLPDILVLTGHDGLINNKKDYKEIGNYRNSKYFVQAVKNARQFEKSKDELIIFAGACQSHYEALIQAGANFASSPKRILIHAFDPVLTVEKLAYAPIDLTVPLGEVIKNTISGQDGVGGIQTKGRYRVGIPKSNY